ncbi:alkaline phosphatase family protein [Cryobacterium sp. 10I1]|uniref:alkaline phosphatase family protein n=1 Tax=Cryobacterium sp. 10I1 TaxID=3048578 RepID=UPI002B23904F|nr:alkaline phosphatase family protein [Cryobacterium sp. 10I1]MEB0305889.1 alkaline phosphatase family protein [Cryobacterium sp. 10I1]
MPPMLPARQFSALRLADVLSSCHAAVLGRENALALAAVDKAVVVLVDGLGVSSLRARAGHARYLMSKLTRAGVVDTVFPATTAAAITSLTTGVEPGRHGLVGYRALDAANDRVVNQLSGWDERMPPETWQRTRTVFERAAGHRLGGQDPPGATRRPRRKTAGTARRTRDPGSDACSRSRALRSGRRRTRDDPDARLARTPPARDLVFAPER